MLRILAGAPTWKIWKKKTMVVCYWCVWKLCMSVDNFLNTSLMQAKFLSKSSIVGILWIFFWFCCCDYWREECFQQLTFDVSFLNFCCVRKLGQLLGLKLKCLGLKAPETMKGSRGLGSSSLWFWKFKFCILEQKFFLCES